MGGAASTASAWDAQAFTTGDHIAFAPGQFAPDTSQGRRLLAHELAHVAQQTTGESAHGHVQRQPAKSRNRKPFDRVLDLHRQDVETLDLLTKEVEALFNPSPALTEIRAIAEGARSRASQANQVVDAYAAGQNVDDMAFDFDPGDYVLGNQVSPTGLARREKLLRNQIALADLIRPRMRPLATYVGQLPADSPTPVRDTFLRLVSYYINLVKWPDDSHAYANLAFLDVFYQDPSVVESYGLIFHIRAELPGMFNLLKEASIGGVGYIVMGSEISSLTGTSPESIREKRDQGLQGKRTAGLMIVANALLALRDATASAGEQLPSNLDEIKKIPTPSALREVAKLYLQSQDQIDLLSVWQAIDPMRQLIYSHNAIGATLNPVVGNAEQDRPKWLNYLTNLEVELAAEFDKDTHTDLASRLKKWFETLKDMDAAIRSEARIRHVTAAIVEQIPFMFVAGATVARVGLWVRGLTTSRILVALAEGAAMTGLSALTTPLAQSRAMGVSGWSVRLGTNILLAGLGRAVFERAATIAEGLAGTRLAFLDLPTRLAAPIAVLSTLQTAAQVIESKAKQQGGESSFTELLTINLVLNGIGVVVGAAVMPEQPRGSTALQPQGSSQLARPTATELAQRFNISEDAARLMLELFDKLSDFDDRCHVLNQLSASGRLTRAQFDQLKQQGGEIADFIESRLAPIAEAGGLGSTTSAQVKAYVAGVRARLAALTYEERPTITAILPQNVEGLTATPDDSTWTYDQSQPPARLPALRASLAGRGYAVRALPSGGWEADGGASKPPVRVIPLPAAAVRVTRTLPDIARGPVAGSGLAAVRAQSGVPAHLLEAQLARIAAEEGGSQAVLTLLQNLGRFIEPSNQRAWRGLSNYIDQGGDPALLGRKLAYGRPREFAAERRDLANKLLEQMAGWDRDAVAGFGALYRLRPQLTAERLHSLVGGVEIEAAQVPGILQSLALLEPRSRGLGDLIGRLTSGDVSSVRGATGGITAGVQLAARFPNGTLLFESPVRNAAGDVVRVIDIRVVETETTRVAGQVRTTEREVGAFEQKEVSTRSLGNRAPQELARDIVRDSTLRAGRVAPAAGSRPFFETFRWQIRRAEFQERAMQSTGATNASDPAVEQAMRQAVEAQLRPVFNRPEFRALPQTEQAGYQGAFAGVPFVEFF